MSTATELLKDYCYQNNVDYAYLLNGNWGVGKTYYVRNTLRKVDSISDKIIYVSLFNVSTWMEVVAALYHELYQSLSKAGNILRPFISNIPNGKINYIYSSLSELIKPFLDDLIVDELKDKLVVFDDLERTQIPIEILLGNINDVLLSKNIHVLIVGDETHFNDNKKEVFLKWKEKIIRRTLSIDDCYEDALKNIIQNRSNPHSTSLCFYNNNKEDFNKAIRNVKVYNLRTWQFAFDIFDELFSKYHSDYYFYLEVFELIILSIQYSNIFSDKESSSFKKYLQEKDLEIDSMNWGSEFRKRYNLQHRIPYVKSLIEYIKGNDIDAKLVYNDITKIYPYIQGIKLVNALLLDYEDIKTEEEIKKLFDTAVTILNSSVDKEINELIKLHNVVESLLDLGYGTMFKEISVIHDKCIELLTHGDFTGSLDDFILENIKNNEELNFVIKILNTRNDSFLFDKFLDYNNLYDFKSDTGYNKSIFISELENKKEEIYKILTSLNHIQAWMFYHFIQLDYLDDTLSNESINRLREVINEVLNNNAVDEYIKIPFKNIIKNLSS